MAYTAKAEKIRTGLSKFKKESVLTRILEFLHSPEKDTLTTTQKMPWLSFLLIEWLYQVDEERNARNATQEEVHGILNNIFSLQSEAVRLDNSINIDLALRKMIIGQFWVQKNELTYWFYLMRIYSLISEGDNAKYFSESFEAYTKINIHDFFSLSFWVLIRFSKGVNHILFKDAVIDLTPHYKITTLAKFFDLIGMPASSLEPFLKTYREESIKVDAYFAETALIARPLLYSNLAIITPHRALASKSLAELPLRIFKEIDNEKFKSKFTREFEKYAEEVMSERGIPYTSEDDIKKIYSERGASGKVVDFIVSDQNSTVFIDAKGIEPHRKVKVSDNPDILRDKLSKSFIHGVKQAYECAEILLRGDEIDIAEYSKRYAIIVTHQEFYILNGKKIKDSISPDLFDGLRNQNGDVSMPPENVYFTCIEDFEGLVALCHESGSTLGDFLGFCVKKDSDPKTKKFDIRQHISDFASEKNAKRDSPIGTNKIMATKDRVFDSLHEIISKNHSFWKKGGIRLIPHYINTHQSLCSRIENLSSLHPKEG